MKINLFVLFCFNLLASVSYSSEPEVTITTKSSYNGFGIVAGKVISKDQGAVGVSLENGGIRYSTIADPAGSWAIVFRHSTINFTVRAWSFNREKDLTEIAETLPIPTSGQKTR